MSVGYVSGYREDSSSGQAVKHIVVNGAFNHGNSGGPLLVSHSNEVIGIVVMIFHFYPPEIKQIIDGLTSTKSGVMLGEIRRPDGTRESVSEAEVTGIALNEFYEKTQIMIGEAVEVSELSAMLKEHASELPAIAPKSKGPAQRATKPTKP